MGAMRWVKGCTPRITVIECDEDIRSRVRMGKVLSLLSQLTFILMFVRQLRKDGGRSGIVGVANVLCLLIAGCGALHSASIIVPLPSSTKQEGLLLCVEFLYTAFNVFLIAALFVMNTLWLKYFHPEAFPQASELTAFYLRGSKKFCVLLASMVGIIGFVTDLMLAIFRTEAVFEALVHTQHNTFMMVCFCGASISFAASGRLIRTCGGVGSAESIEAARRMIGARNVILFLWVFCLVFCTGCASLSTDKHTRGANPSSTVERFVWIMHSSFILMGGGAFASVVFMLIHRRCLFAAFSCVSAHKAVDSSRIPQSPSCSPPIPGDAPATLDVPADPSVPTEVSVVSPQPEDDL